MSHQPVLRIFAPWIVTTALWLWLIFHLQVEWSLNSQYNYGWAVPFLALLMFWFRWQRRPPPRPSRKGPATWARWVILLLLLPIRIVEEANPDWRLLSWVLAFSVVSFSLLSFYRAGGRDWLKHFAFPI